MSALVVDLPGVARGVRVRPRVSAEAAAFGRDALVVFGVVLGVMVLFALPLMGVWGGPVLAGVMFGVPLGLLGRELGPAVSEFASRG